MKKLTLEEAKMMTPKGYFDTFYEMSQIPRGTFNCEAISAFLAKKFASYPNTTVTVDKALNVKAVVKATPGYENYPKIGLQAHMDMVCAKDETSTHDFKKDPIELIIEGNTIHANNTTLGADDGSGVCVMFAILENNIPHGPLEFLVTTDEEDRNLGALALENNVLTCKYLINVDTESFKDLFIGCVSCISQDIEYEVKREAMNDARYIKLGVKGLKGGHSGLDIYQKLLNAIKSHFDILYNLAILNNLDVRLVDVVGGQAKNSIPTFAYGTIAVKNSDFAKAKELIEKMQKDYKEEYEDFDTPEFSLEEISNPQFLPVVKERSDEIIRGYNAMYNGMSVYNVEHTQSETSTNLGLIETHNEKIKSYSYVRSLYENAVWRIYNQVRSVVELSHGKVECSLYLPPWTPIYKHNPILESYKKIYKEVTGKDTIVNTCPGGLECATLLKKCPSIKYIISCGPQIDGCHSKTETMQIDTAIANYNIIAKMLEDAKNWW